MLMFVIKLMDFSKFDTQKQKAKRKTKSNKISI